VPAVPKSRWGTPLRSRCTPPRRRRGCGSGRCCTHTKRHTWQALVMYGAVPVYTVTSSHSAAAPPPTPTRVWRQESAWHSPSLAAAVTGAHPLNGFTGSPRILGRVEYCDVLAIDPVGVVIRGAQRPARALRRTNGMASSRESSSSPGCSLPVFKGELRAMGVAPSGVCAGLRRRACTCETRHSHPHVAARPPEAQALPARTH
jgi:hypothetical protein